MLALLCRILTQFIHKQVDVVLLLKTRCQLYILTKASVFIVIVISGFIIGELFCNSLITLLCIAKEAHFEQTAFNNLLRTEESSQLFYGLSIVFFPQILSTKPQGYPSFSYVYVGTYLFRVEEICIF